MKKYILLVLCLLSIVILSSCGDKYRKKINEEYYEFSLDDYPRKGFMDNIKQYRVTITAPYLLSNFEKENSFSIEVINDDDFLLGVYIDNNYYKYMKGVTYGEWLQYESIMKRRTSLSDIEGMSYKIQHYDGEIRDGIDVKEYTYKYDLNEYVPFKREGKTLISMYYAKRGRMVGINGEIKLSNVLFSVYFQNLKINGKEYYKVYDVDATDISKAYITGFEFDNGNSIYYSGFFSTMIVYNYLIYTLDNKDFICFGTNKTEFMEYKEKFGFKKRDYIFLCKTGGTIKDDVSDLYGIGVDEILFYSHEYLGEIITDEYKYYVLLSVDKLRQILYTDNVKNK